MRYKGMVHNVLNDAPFIGALIVANGCSMPCTHCINEHLKSKQYEVQATAEAIVEQVRLNGLNEGVILSGLEWSEQPQDLVELVSVALKYRLKVMIYTHHTEQGFFKRIPALVGKPVYIKFGLYDVGLKSDCHYSHGVQLATTNQYIKYFEAS